MSERIAVISSSYPRAPGDPAGHFVESEVRCMLRAGHEVHVFAAGSGPSASEGAQLHWLADGEAFGWPGALTRLKENPTRVLGATAFVARAVHALRNAGSFTRVQAHFLVPCAWPIATLAFDPSRAPELELVGHGSDVRLFCGLPQPLRRHIARAWGARAARLRVTSHELSELLCAANPELTSAVRVAASPIDVSGVPDRQGARLRLGLSKSQSVALIVSRLVPGKQVDRALRSLTLVDELQVVVVGDGPELRALRAQFPEVRFTGRLPRPETLVYISAADVVVSASPQEGAPSVVREARALGVPVIAVAAGDLAAWARADRGLLLVQR